MRESQLANRKENKKYWKKRSLRRVLYGSVRDLNDNIGEVVKDDKGQLYLIISVNVLKTSMGNKEVFIENPSKELIYKLKYCRDLSCEQLSNIWRIKV